jgi:hypothetical protein
MSQFKQEESFQVRQYYQERNDEQYRKNGCKKQVLLLLEDDFVDYNFGNNRKRHLYEGIQDGK